MEEASGDSIVASTAYPTDPIAASKVMEAMEIDEIDAVSTDSNFFSGLPVEVLHRLLTEYVGPSGVAKLASLSKSMLQICKNYRLWREFCRKELRVKLKDLEVPYKYSFDREGGNEFPDFKRCAPSSYFDVYTKVIYPFRGLLDFAMVSHATHYGEIVTLSYKNGVVKGEMWFLPKVITDPMVSTWDFFAFIDEKTNKLTVHSFFANNQAEPVEEKWRHSVKIVDEPQETQKIFLGMRRHEDDEGPRRKLLQFLHIRGVSWPGQAGMGGIDPGPDIFWHHRGLYKIHALLSTVRPFDFADGNHFKRIRDLPGKTVPTVLKDILPLGLFKGSYGVHGNELVRMWLEQDNEDVRITGTKMTGDPNVPSGKNTFYFSLKKAVMMEATHQADVEFLEALEADGPFLEAGPGQTQSFRVPDGGGFEDRFDARALPPHCTLRLVGHATVAGTNFTNAQSIIAHLIVLSKTSFVVLWLSGLDSATLFEKMSDSDPFTRFL
ncbi:hypothetical protein RvY_02701 [Ramazzottius varieornatus]|uniref:F-box domain-containing protein n=1 Tax=Ramazzottius varieornatus TaxID=947166 RepID=A0A1D1UVS1_RAMVA|nr:hypothetical protein RvY_02701 [Ramazzottius varieornatus]